MNVSEDNVLKAVIDGHEIKYINRKKRSDVYATYSDLYVDIDENTIGWYIELDKNELLEGKHKLEMSIISKSGKELTKKEVNFSIE